MFTRHPHRDGLEVDPGLCLDMLGPFFVEPCNPNPWCGLTDAFASNSKLVRLLAHASLLHPRSLSTEHACTRLMLLTAAAPVIVVVVLVVVVVAGRGARRRYCEPVPFISRKLRIR